MGRHILIRRAPLCALHAYPDAGATLGQASGPGQEPLSSVSVSGVAPPRKGDMGDISCGTFDDTNKVPIDTDDDEDDQDEDRNHAPFNHVEGDTA